MIDLGVLTVSALIILIDYYSETQIKNYGSLIERLAHLINIKSLFNILKLTSLLSAVLILFSAPFDFISKTIPANPTSFPFEILSYPILFTFFIILFDHISITKQFSNYNLLSNYPRIATFLSNLQFLLFRLISFVLIFYVLTSVYYGFQELYTSLKSNDLQVFDWIVMENSQEENYNKGVFFSLILTLTLFFIFNNAFLKRESTYFEYRKIRLKFFLYFFISIILSIGFFFGFFSIFNGIYNLLNTGFTDWITKENILGILPIRISAVLILFYLITYIYKRVLNNNLIGFLKVGILPLRRDTNQYSSMLNLYHKETLFFCQISFYVINLALAEMFIIYGHEAVYLSILNFSILFILDDFTLIDDYNRYFGKILKKHFIRLTFFNIVMICAAIVALISYEFYFYLFTYLIIVMILTIYYLRNLHHYRQTFI